MRCNQLPSIENWSSHEKFGEEFQLFQCYHLYTVVTYESMNECSHPEIICIQPTLAILKLKNFGIDSVELFEWLEPSPLGRIREAHQTLIWLKALNDNNSLTDLSRNMSHLGVDPK
ncbi:unnamed protein product [Didymodactylos carnosus]|uniref:Uncharacterized protein n=1 Tax=Didymodactylos carnosus TaxID=1234261 RepID=A0A8S2VX50_9BILA|nr:unnamed protein product [Didymodactylos carnosus]CAF4413376.1 unnamed protein product [Didymodactylos carnosus]